MSTHTALEAHQSTVNDFCSTLQSVQLLASSCMPASTTAICAELNNAEVALKREATKDHYKILGAHREVDLAGIRKAYSRERLMYYPDKGGDEEK